MATSTTTLTKDPVTGMFMANTGTAGPGMTMIDLNGGPVTPPSSQGTDPYTIFNKNLMDMLTRIQAGQSTNRPVLAGAKDALTTMSVAPNGPQPANPGVFSDSTVQSQKTLQGAFAPAITSVNTQLENTDAALHTLGADIGTMASVYKPTEVSPGSSLVGPDGRVIKQGHQYQPQINPMTGMLDGFDITTGTWQSNDTMHSEGGIGYGGDTTVATSTGPVDFSGKNTGVGNYAGTTTADAANYAKSVGTIYSSLMQTFPQPNAPGYDQYISGHAKGAPLTGQMILNAATQYGIDANMLTAMLAHETDFGTSGEAPKNYNPGGVKFVGQSGATQGSAAPEGGNYAKFGSWQQGVNAVAAQIARRQGAGTQTSTSSGQGSTSPVGGIFSQTAAQKVAAMPAPMQPYVDAGPKGVAYINDERVPANVKDSVKIMAARAGIPYLDAGNASAIKSIGVVYQSLDGLKTLTDEQLNSGWLGALQDIGKASIHNATFGNAWPSLSQFNAYRDTAIKAVQGLAGGTGSGLRINAAEIEANLTNLPTPTDTTENAYQKLIGITSLLDKQLAATFPYIQTDSPNTTMGTSAANTHVYNGITYKVINGQWVPQQ